MTVMGITGFDHLVLRSRDVEASLAWYVERLGLAPVRVDAWRAGQVPFPSVRVDARTIIDIVPGGAGDGRNVDHFCLVADRATVDAASGGDAGLDVVDGPGTRFGARGDGWSVYVTDPDGNVVELRSYD